MKPLPFSPRPMWQSASRARRPLFLALCLGFIWTIYFFSFSGEFPLFREEPAEITTLGPVQFPTSAEAGGRTSRHPVEILHEKAVKDFEAKLARQSQTLKDAVAQYKLRYKRPPPPHFDKWFQYAQKNKSPIIDDYDSIEESLRPFWGLPPAVIRARSKLAASEKNRMMGFKIENGQINYVEGQTKWRIETELKMMLPRELLQHLPDMYLSFNCIDEPRNVVPSDMMNEMLGDAEQNMGAAANGTEKHDGFSKTPENEEGRLKLEKLQTTFNSFGRQSTWDHSKLSCPTGTPSRALYYEEAKRQQDSIFFATNVTAIKDVCQNLSYQLQHGFFAGPDTYIVTQNLVPIFSQSKPSTYSDILFPNFWYFWKSRTGEDSVGLTPWEQRTDKLYWRGSSTGGYSSDGSWRQLHRQRFVSLANDGNHSVMFFEKVKEGTGWVLKRASRNIFKKFFDVYFTRILQCSKADCRAQKKYFYISREQEFQKKEKFVVDLEGNAFSGRYYTLLKSGAVVFKQAILKEWHDERLVPWLHYIPLTMEGTEIHEILRYFRTDNDALAKKIAQSSVDWMKKGVRRVDMKVYFFRLLLELARIMDNDRENIGFTMD